MGPSRTNNIRVSSRVHTHTHSLGPSSQAHDDVLLEVPCEQWPAVKSVVAEVMEGALLPQHRLMLKAAVSAGATWLECK